MDFFVFCLFFMNRRLVISYISKLKNNLTFVSYLVIYLLSFQ